VRAAAGLLLFALAGRLQAQPLEGPLGPPRAIISLGFVVASAKPAGDQWHEGFGGELAVLAPLRLGMGMPFAAGGFGQLQGMDGFSGATRVSGGVRLQAWMLGFDMGFAQQSGDDFHSATGYVVLAPGLQAGPGALALRFSWPVTGGAHWPRETALTFTIRLPLLLGGEGRRRGPQ